MAIDSVLWVQFGVFGDLSDRTNWTEFPPSVIYYSEQLVRNTGMIHTVSSAGSDTGFVEGSLGNRQCCHRPVRIENKVGMNDLDYFIPTDAVLERFLQMEGQFIDAIQRNQAGHSDETAVTRRQLRPLITKSIHLCFQPASPFSNQPFSRFFDSKESERGDTKQHPD